MTDPPKGTGPGVYTVTDPFGIETVPKTGPAILILEADRERIDGTVGRSRVNKRPIRHDFGAEPVPCEHNKNSALSLAVIIRFKATRKWPIIVKFGKLLL